MTAMLGREHELGLLLQHLTTTAGVPVAVVTGEAGIGKSTLAKEAAEALRGLGWTVRWARGTRDGDTPPFWLWQQALGEPVLAGTDRFVLFEQLRDRLTADTPGLLVVDDVQWSDEPSLRALLHVVRHTRTSGLAVLLTQRTFDEPGSAWEAVGGDLVREPTARGFALAGLAATDARAVVVAAASEELPGSVVAHACSLADGNPFFLTELARCPGPELPQTLSEVVHRRVGGLSASAQELMHAASVLGEEVDLAVAARLVGSRALAVLPAVDEALAAGLLRRAGSQVRFAHGIVRRALEEQLSLQQLVALHLRAADALEELHADDLAPHVAQLARHWCAAAVAGDPEPGIRWAARAAELATAALAWEEASRLYDLALSTGGARLAGARRAELLLSRAAADVAAGRLPVAHAACREAVALADGRSDLVAGAALTLEAVGQRSWDRDLVTWCTAALGDPDLDATLRARVLGRLTEASSYSGEWTAADETSAAALALGAASDDALAAGLRARQLARSGPEHTDERRALADRMIALGTARQSPADELWGLLWRIDTSWERGRLQDVESDLTRLAHCVEQVRTPMAQWHLHVSRAALAQARGQLGTALEHADAGLAAMVAMGHPAAFGAWLALVSSVGHHAGHRPQALAPPSGGAASAGEVNGEVFASIGPAVGLAEEGRLEEAAALYRRPGPPWEWAVPPYFTKPALGCGVLTASILGLEDDLRWYQEQLQHHRGGHIVGGAGVGNYLGPVELHLGLAAAALGDLETAEAELTQAARTARDLGAEGFAAEADIRLAEVHARAGRPATARPLALAAKGVAQRLGMTPWVARAQALLAERDPLSNREREVAALLVEGLSNKEIADRLVLSERTAENHVQSILRKLGLANRSQVAVHMSTRSSTSPDGTAAGRP